MGVKPLALILTGQLQPTAQFWIPDAYVSKPISSTSNVQEVAYLKATPQSTPAPGSTATPSPNTAFPTTAPTVTWTQAGQPTTFTPYTIPSPTPNTNPDGTQSLILNPEQTVNLASGASTGQTTFTATTTDFGSVNIVANTYNCLGLSRTTGPSGSVALAFASGVASPAAQSQADIYLTVDGNGVTQVTMPYGGAFQSGNLFDAILVAPSVPTTTTQVSATTIFNTPNGVMVFKTHDGRTVKWLPAAENGSSVNTGSADNIYGPYRESAANGTFDI
jgi:hypothetical protein